MIDFKAKREDSQAEAETAIRLLKLEVGDKVDLMLRQVPLGQSIGQNGLPMTMPQFIGGTFLALEGGVIVIQSEDPSGSASKKLAFPYSDVYMSAPGNVAVAKPRIIQ